MKESCCWKIKMLVSKYTVWNKHSQAANWFFQAQLSLYEPYYSSWRRMVCICFGVVVIILTLIFCLKYWYQDDHNQLKWGCIKVFQSSLQKGWDENLFFQCRNLILLIDFHSRYITACFANVYSDISRLTLFCSCFFFFAKQYAFWFVIPKMNVQVNRPITARFNNWSKKSVLLPVHTHSKNYVYFRYNAKTTKN